MNICSWRILQYIAECHEIVARLVPKSSVTIKKIAERLERLIFSRNNARRKHAYVKRRTIVQCCTAVRVPPENALSLWVRQVRQQHRHTVRRVEGVA